MATRPKDMNIIKQVLTGRKNGMTIRQLAENYGMSPTTVQNYINMAKEDKLGIEALLKLEDPELSHRFHGGTPAYCDKRQEDFLKRVPYFEEELKKKHMTKQLLWEEYRKECPDGYGITQFKFHLEQNVAASKSSTVLKILYQAGDRMYIDFAGDRLSYWDMSTGEEVKVEVFATVMPFSGMTFVEAVESQRLEHYLMAIADALEFYGGVPLMLVPDNLKAAVNRAARPGKCPAEITQGMNDLATHYGCNVKPARPYKPKDKALVEDAVHKAYMRIYAPLRNSTFYSLAELNKAIRTELDKYNSKRMQGCDYSRLERFVSAEKPALLPLPEKRFEMKWHKLVKVATTSFITIGTERHRYSVPCRLIGQQVEAIYTSTQVRVFYRGECVATHERSYAPGKHTYQLDHLPSQTQAYYSYSASYFIAKAAPYGQDAAEFMARLFNDGRPAEVNFQSAQGVLGLLREADPGISQLAIRVAITFNKCNYGFFKSMIESECIGYQAFLCQDGDSAPSADHANIRGPEAFK